MKKTISIILILVLCIATKVTNADFIFGTPINLGPTVNTSSNDAGPSISTSGLSLYFTSDRPGGFGESDLYVSTRAKKNDPWGAPSNLGAVVNSSSTEGTPSISADGLKLYFMSNRQGSSEDRDIWVTRRTAKNEDWSTPVNLGPTVNTSFKDCCPNISTDGLSLFFFSDRPGSGGWDIWVTTRTTEKDKWAIPTNLGPIVNSSALENAPSISKNGLWLFFSSDRPGGSNGQDLWLTTRTTVSGPWSTPVNLGLKVNSLCKDSGPDISKDGRTLYFSSDRPGKGKRDLWQVSISPIVDPNGDEIVNTDDM